MTFSLMHEITAKDLAKGRKLRVAAIASPFVLMLVPALITLLLMFVAASGPPVAAVILFFGLIATTLGFVSGLAISIVLTYRRNKWTREMRERIAADGI